MHYALGDYVADLVQNSLEAGARSVRLTVREDARETAIEVVDDGRGMGAEERERAMDPFRSGGAKHPGRKVGLGLPFLAQAAGQTGGSLSVESAEGAGTTVRCSFPAGHPDAPPTGDLAAALLSLMAFGGDYELEVIREAEREGERVSYAFRRSELLAAAGDPGDAGALALMRAFITSQERGG
jgi:hypothetical protein